jgi:beta-galactosidase
MGRIRVATCTRCWICPHLSFEWSLEAEGAPVATGHLEVPPLAPGEQATVPLPPLPATEREWWLTVRALLAADEPWAPAGHEIAWGQLPITPAGGASGRAAAPPPAGGPRTGG